MLSVLLGGRAWIGRLVAGLAIVVYAGYRLIAGQPGQVTLVAAALGSVIIVFALFSALRHDDDTEPGGGNA